MQRGPFNLPSNPIQGLESRSLESNHKGSLTACASLLSYQDNRSDSGESLESRNLESHARGSDTTCASLHSNTEDNGSDARESSCDESYQCQDDGNIEPEDQSIDMWLHPIHGSPCDSDVQAFPVKLTEDEVPCHPGSALLQEPLMTVGVRCTRVDGFLRASHNGKQIAIPLLHSNIVGVADAPGSIDLVVVRLIEASHGMQSHDCNEWLVLCKSEDRLAVLDSFGASGCCQHCFSEQYVLQMDNLLGAGASAVVCIAKKISTSQNMAAKLFKVKASDEKLVREVKFLSLAGRNENVVRFHGIFENIPSRVDSQMCFFLFDYYACGDLYKQVLKSGPFQGEQAMQVITSLFMGLCHIHKLGIVHRQVNPENCLVGDDGRIVLSGFGSAASLTEQELLMERVGSLSFAAPEVYKGEAQDTKTDMFSAGITLFFTLSKQHPFQGHSPSSTIRRTLTGKVNWSAFGTPDVHSDVRHMLANLLSVSRHSRPSANKSIRQVRSWRIC